MNGRLQSLDAFRGFTIAGMLLVNNPGTWNHVYPQLLHSEWNGMTFTDWIFPFFVFISGMSMGMSLSKRTGPGVHRWQLLARTVRRGGLIILIGLLLNFVPAFDLSTLRIPGVLQRLGLCTVLAAPIVLWCGTRGIALWALALMAVYAAIQLFVPVPDADGIVARGALLPGKDVGAWLDRALMEGHLWQSARTWDPEGLLSTMPAVASQLLGVLAARALASSHVGAAGMALRFAAVGVLSLILGQALDAWLMPINKSLWTPSYVVATTGWALLLFAAFLWLLDGTSQPQPREWLRRLARPLVVLGMNALFIFVLSILLAKLLANVKLHDGRTLKAALYAPIEALPIAPMNSSLLFAIGFVLVMYAVAWLMWRRGWFVKV